MFLAVFFALIIKKVDEEDYQCMVVVETGSHPGRRSWRRISRALGFNFELISLKEFSAGGDKDPQTVRTSSGVYQPPAPADIEKMRKNKILEEKAFAFLKEFLSE